MINKLYKLLPAALRNKILSTVTRRVRHIQKIRDMEVEERLPKIDLKSEHIMNLKILTNKLAILDVIPKNSVVAEVGVSHGKYSENILSVTQPKKLYLIDSWTQERYKGRGLTVEKKFEREIKLGQVIIKEGFSTTELAKFDDGYFDWVYIDTDHTYDTTAKELEICCHKVKPGGFIAGHDYNIGSWVSRIRYGVVEAVNEYCVKYNWEMLYLTHEYHRNLSFVLRQISK